MSANHVTDRARELAKQSMQKGSIVAQQNAHARAMLRLYPRMPVLARRLGFTRLAEQREQAPKLRVRRAGRAPRQSTNIRSRGSRRAGGIRSGQDPGDADLDGEPAGPPARRLDDERVVGKRALEGVAA